MPKAYNNLVRDRVPEIIESEGKFATVRELTHGEYAIALVHKLKESVSEYAADPTETGLADIMELIHAIAGERYGLTPEKLEEVRVAVAKRRGGFHKRLMLVEESD